MSTTLPTPNQSTPVEDDPKRPWKAVVAIVLAVAITLVQVIQSQWGDGNWTREDTIVTVLAFLSALTVYLVPNPKIIST